MASAVITFDAPSFFPLRPAGLRTDRSPHDAARVDAAVDQFAHALRAGHAVNQHYDMIGQLFLNAGHAKFLPAALDDEIIGCAHEDEQDRDPHGG